MDLRHDQSSKMSYRPQTKVALLVESSRSYGRELLRGVARFAHTRSSWSLLHQEMTIDAITPNWLKASGVGGVIARVDSHTIDALRQLNVPIVDVRCRRSFPFVCNDIRGQQVLNACKAQEIAVPDDLGVIGVDNDDAICLLSDPPLTSVCPNAEQVRYRAAEILNEMLTGKFNGPQVGHNRVS